MYGPGHGWGFGLFWQIGAVLGSLVIALAVIALLILLVRYLVVATRAAQLYVDAHSAPGTAPRATEPPPATAAPAPAPAADPTPPNVPVGTKPTRTRTPKTPPAV